MVNTVVIEGIVVVPAAMGKLPDGHPVARMRIAVKQYAPGGKSEMFFLPVVIYGRQAGLAVKVCRKGRHVIVTGRLKITKLSSSQHRGEEVEYTYIDGGDFQAIRPIASDSEEGKGADSEDDQPSPDLVDDDLPF